MVLVLEKTFRERLRMKASNIASTTNIGASARVPAAISESTAARDPRIMRLFVVMAVINPLNAEMNITSEKNAHPEGFVLAMRNTPSGTDVIKMVTNGARRACMGIAEMSSAKARTAITELVIRIVNVEATMSVLTNQLMVQ